MTNFKTIKFHKVFWKNTNLIIKKINKPEKAQNNGHFWVRYKWKKAAISTFRNCKCSTWQSFVPHGRRNQLEQYCGGRNHAPSNALQDVEMNKEVATLCRLILQMSRYLMVMVFRKGHNSTYVVRVENGLCMIVASRQNWITRCSNIMILKLKSD